MDNNGLVKQLICRFQSDDSGRAAFTLYDGARVTEITYRQFAEDILKAAGYFAENRIKGKHIAIAAANSYDWITVFLAIAATGNIAVLLNQDLPADIMRWQCEKTDVDLLCYEDPEVQGKAENIPGIAFREMIGTEPLRPEDIHSHEADETMLMMLTSGTTGASKAVVLSAWNVFSSAEYAVSSSEQEESEKPVDIMSLPLYHIGSVRLLIHQLLTKAPVAIGRGAKYLFMDLPKLNPTRVPMVPAMAESLVKMARRATPEKMVNYVGRNFKNIQAVGASMKSSVAECLLERGIGINVIYGMTESAGAGTWCKLDTAHVGTIGKPDGNVSIRIQDGEILLKSDSVMKGYYKDPEETAKVIVDGWLHTGDMGYCDEDGYYYITGRKKNVIILSNGENVNPEEIEAVFGNCEAIDECMVYSDGKGICADIFANDRDMAAAYIRSYNDDMPMYRQVYKVNYTDEPLPKTGSGKIKRKENV